MSTSNIHASHEYPWVPMTALCIGMLAHSVVFTSPMPYVAFMVVDFGLVSSVDSAGYWAGWITGMFMIGRVIAGQHLSFGCNHVHVSNLILIRR